MSAAPHGPGTVLAGRFLLDDLLDDSAGARFWRATDQTLARSVAVHVLSADDPRADDLLIAARTSALVSDGHLLRVLDAAAQDGVVYVVNEWGSGVSLDRLLAEGPLSPRRAAWVVKEVAEAISTAHRNGVAHGRLLPENVMVTETGSVKLIGFVVDAVLKSRAGRDQVRVTGGEPMSAHEADVVNLGALLYAALVARWPGTEGSTVPDAPSEHGRPLRPRQVRAGVPRPLDAICDRVLNPEGHHASVPMETAHEVYAALSDYIGDPSASPAPEATTLLDAADIAADLEAVRAHMAVADDDPATRETGGHPRRTEQPEPVDETGELAATGAFEAFPEPASDREDAGGDDDRPEPDPESTQAGTPVFFDENTGVGWMSSAEGRGLRSDEAGPPAAPPPPFTEAPERPLFAEGPWRTPQPAEGADTGSGLSFFRSTGAGNGRVPESWGPDRNDGDEVDTSWADDRRRGGGWWLRVAGALVALVVLVAAVVLAFNLGRGSGGDDATASPSQDQSASRSAPARTPYRIAGVTDFDPQGDPPEENPQLAPLAVDGKPGTAWQTMTYRNNPKLGGLKAGVGLLVDLGRPREVGSVRLRLNGTPTALDVLAAPDAQAAPSSTDGLTKVASTGSAGEKATLTVRKPVSTRWLVVWLTSLPSAPGGFQGRVAEVSVTS